MKRKICLLALLCLFGSALAQNKNSGLVIGDRVPDVVLTGVINHSSDQIRLSEYKGKLLILDFWATWCSPCIAMMPKSDSLQKAFADQIQILPVTYQSEKDVQRLLAKASKLKNVTLPFVTGDTILTKLFPHKELPHYVWIDKAGTVVAITGRHEVNAVTIKKMLAESGQALVQKKDAMKPYDPETPLLFQPLGIQRKQILFQSLLSSYVEGVQSRFDVIRDEQGSVTRITMANAWIQLMFSLAWSDETRYFSRNRIVLEVKDPSVLISNQEGEPLRAWLRNHAWCYEVIVPKLLSAKVFEIMRSDMTRLFPQYIASVEKRAMPCLVLVRTSDIDKLKSSQTSSVSNADAFSLSITNSSIQLLVSQLN
ncbi:MAG TPA: TlpA disulfide reductase family protein, partial [Chryseolinea sp.]|nr:TlpA disulfide reductase family protein [Chryseolinea sp.]